MALLTRSHYVSFLTKLASGTSSVPEIDNQEIAQQEQQHNLTDTRGTLKELFSGFAAAQKGHTSEIKKTLPRGEKEVSSPMLKLASWPYIQAMQSAFLEELEKIGMSAQKPDIRTPRAPVMTGDTLHQFRSITGGGGGVAPATVGYVDRRVAPAAARFGAEHGLAPAVAARRAAAAKGGGLLSKLFRAAA